VIVLAGATGNLGGRILRCLVSDGAQVRALVRPSTSAEAIDGITSTGAEVVVADFQNPAGLRAACAGASCIVSALSGLRDVIVDAQGALLDAAVSSGVPRFIPSDYCIDFTKLPDGSNRNLDLRREFHVRLDRAAIRPTSIFNGAFADMLTGQAPIVLFKYKRVLYWGRDDQLMDFTTIDETAAFTARAALDESTPRFLRIAGDQLSARGIANSASKATGDPFKLTRAGRLGRLALIIRIARTLFPAPNTLYPPWQGMQYLHNMFDGRAKLLPLDNSRYVGMTWTSVRSVLEAHATGSASLTEK
jgi:Predicted nucleoside-diphosphate-sugar epimerases